MSPATHPPPSKKAQASQAIVGLQAALRTESGKGGARRVRSTGQVPAIAYGKGLPATQISVTPKEVLAILKSERGQNSVIDMKLGDGKGLLVMIREFSYHPVKRNLEHVDFVEVKLDREVEVEIPLLFTGKPIGVTTGGIVRQVYRTVPVRCLPNRIPLKVEVDISHLAMGEHVSTQDLKLEEGVTVRLPAEQTLIAIVAPEKDRGEAEAAPAAAGAPAAAAAPAAKGAAPAAKGAAPATKTVPPPKDAKKK